VRNDGVWQPETVDDRELARRSILGFGEMVAVLGRSAVGPQAEVRRPDVLGARIDIAGENHWLDAAVVPLGATAPVDDDSLPHCIWSTGDRVPGRVENPLVAMPCMGLVFDRVRDEALCTDGVEAASLTAVGEVNDRAYGVGGRMAALFENVRDERITTYGLRSDGRFVSVAIALVLGNDVAVHYVATDMEYRRRGLGTRVVRAVLADAQARGMRSATLQSTAEAYRVYERLGFRRVAVLRAYLRRGTGTRSAMETERDQQPESEPDEPGAEGGAESPAADTPPAAPAKDDSEVGDTDQHSSG
jgi:ribosomal protein S18 acetylase RimI-like enzyme